MDRPGHAACAGSHADAAGGSKGTESQVKIVVGQAKIRGLGASALTR